MRQAIACATALLGLCGMIPGCRQEGATLQQAPARVPSGRPSVAYSTTPSMVAVDAAMLNQMMTATAQRTVPATNFTSFYGVYPYGSYTYAYRYPYGFARPYSWYGSGAIFRQMYGTTENPFLAGGSMYAFTGRSGYGKTAGPYIPPFITQSQYIRGRFDSRLGPARPYSGTGKAITLTRQADGGD